MITPLRTCVYWPCKLFSNLKRNQNQIARSPQTAIHARLASLTWVSFIRLRKFVIGNQFFGQSRPKMAGTVVLLLCSWNKSNTFRVTASTRGCYRGENEGEWPYLDETAVDGSSAYVSVFRLAIRWWSGAIFRHNWSFGSITAYR